MLGVGAKRGAGFVTDALGPRAKQGQHPPEEEPSWGGGQVALSPAYSRGTPPREGDHAGKRKQNPFCWSCTWCAFAGRGEGGKGLLCACVASQASSTPCRYTRETWARVGEKRGPGMGGTRRWRCVGCERSTAQAFDPGGPRRGGGSVGSVCRRYCISKPLASRRGCVDVRVAT